MTLFPWPKTKDPRNIVRPPINSTNHASMVIMMLRTLRRCLYVRDESESSFLNFSIVSLCTLGNKERSVCYLYRNFDPGLMSKSNRIIEKDKWFYLVMWDNVMKYMIASVKLNAMMTRIAVLKIQDILQNEAMNPPNKLSRSSKLSNWQKFLFKTFNVDVSIRKTWWCFP